MKNLYFSEWIPFYVLSLLLNIIGLPTEENKETMAAGRNGENYVLIKLTNAQQCNLDLVQLLT